MGHAFTPDRPFQVILIAEDEDLIRDLVCEFLEDAGFRVVEVANAAQAMDVVSDHPEIDLVMTDINMPGKMDGHGLADWISTNRPQLPVLLTSGRVYCPGGRSPRQRFIAKPFALAALEREIRELLTDSLSEASFSKTAGACVD